MMLTRHLAVDVVTRFENLNLVFDEICNFVRKIEEILFLFFGERHRNIAIRR